MNHSSNPPSDTPVASLPVDYHSYWALVGSKNEIPSLDEYNGARLIRINGITIVSVKSLSMKMRAELRVIFQSLEFRLDGVELIEPI